jgi:hypothetical protein
LLKQNKIKMDIKELKISNANFRIVCPKTSKLIKSYLVEFTDYKHLNQLFQESRKVWDEYQVSAETEAFVLGNSHTYREQLEFELSKNS